MSEIGEFYSEWHKQRGEKRKANKDASTKIIREAGVKFRSRNNGVHLIILNDEGRAIYDFWPSTGKYIKRSTKQHGRGVHNLIKELQS